MPVVRTGETALEKEEAKWNARKRDGGMNADGYEPFPKMLYKARVRPNGQPGLDDPGNEGFAASCQRIVYSDAELRAAQNEGWRIGQQAALEHYEQVQQDIARAAAEANAAATRMSPKAQAERKKREDAAGVDHVPE